jgi:NAD/NADP transhydrogenase beta subunit
MTENKPQSVRTLGSVLKALSGLIVFSNSMGAFAYFLTGMGDMPSSSGNVEPDEQVLVLLVENFLTLCLIMIAVGLLYFVGAHSLKTFKLWALRLITWLSGLLILIVLGVTAGLLNAMRNIEGSAGDELWFPGLVTTLVIVTPLALVIWFLNRPKIRKHFTQQLL